MSFASINPASGELVERFEPMDDAAVAARLEAAARAATAWAAETLAARCALLTRVATLLREHKTPLAALITVEMGKLIGEAEAEVEKCALACQHYAEQARAYLADELIPSDAGRSLIACTPLGPVLAVMPWNFPFWQVFRCAAPALAAGNPVLLKHASNVPGCALAIEDLFRDAGAPEGVFSALMIEAGRVDAVIAHPAVRAVSLTGSDVAGRKVAAAAGAHLKKTVLELGGSDAFVVLGDADLDLAAEMAVQARFMNAGQSCIAAKRFIVVASVEAAFMQRFRAGIEALRPGDPADPQTTLAPMARADLRDELHAQVQASVEAGAVLVMGGKALDRPGFFYAPTLLDHVGPGMPAYTDELFGPVAAVIRAADEKEALGIANDSRFGLGGSVWTEDATRGERFARQMACGCAFVNGMVKSDPRLPFGGIGDSGYGRELSRLGIREFVNEQTLWVR
ncbi:MAG: NAD-dependent succinate-semialdehyde dehydrogenase [Thiohalocapsa sp.]|jgi:succinate-semialdehyde dehydrogenase/glutarate-semialdehyde dehydrogenase|uniref:NAD-dependent succinate-semialdehyde dehydrogenase n=1 Tax=Thiohalocapsa sp. TaxID=2497641 RepID=UPI0025E4BAB2|nr:NAD-dependent succinate-semialdehyde dehydrogenase [Thiohalocapsa sp.]MCG6941918.1 NAD-dependent succinate-semialdehyde dehydrogenase [Thiohalocapsa sp.]